MEFTTVICSHCGKPNRVPAAAEGRPRCGNCHQWLPWITLAGDHDFSEVAEKASVPVIVDVWATWCGPCQVVSPALGQLAAERAGRLKLVKVNVDEAPGIAQRFTVRAVPTLLLIIHGQVVARRSGAASVAVLMKWLDKSLEEHNIKEAHA
jgi:thioredoxin 2